MDIVTIECPNCGAEVKRSKGEYFAACPYCGKEICFDEIKEEAEVSAFKDKLNELEQKDELEQRYKAKMLAWLKTRDVFFIIMGLCQAVGFFLVGLSDSENPADNTKLMIGSICVIISTALLFFTPLCLGSVYPSYNILSEKNEPSGKLKAGLKLFVIAVGIWAAGALIAYFGCSLLNKT